VAEGQRKKKEAKEARQRESEMSKASMDAAIDAAEAAAEAALNRGMHPQEAQRVAAEAAQNFCAANGGSGEQIRRAALEAAIVAGASEVEAAAVSHEAIESADARRKGEEKRREREEMKKWKEDKEAKSKGKEDDRLRAARILIGQIEKAGAKRQAEEVEDKERMMQQAVEAAEEAQALLKESEDIDEQMVQRRRGSKDLVDRAHEMSSEGRLPLDSDAEAGVKLEGDDGFMAYYQGHNLMTGEAGSKEDEQEVIEFLSPSKSRTPPVSPPGGISNDSKGASRKIRIQPPAKRRPPSLVQHR